MVKPTIVESVKMQIVTFRLKRLYTHLSDLWEIANMLISNLGAPLKVTPLFEGYFT